MSEKTISIVKETVEKLNSLKSRDHMAVTCLAAGIAIGKAMAEEDSKDDSVKREADS